MKKWWLLGVLSAMVIAFAVTAFSMRSEKRETVGLCFDQPTDGFNTQYRQALTDSLRQSGYDVLELDAHGDQAKQFSQMQLLTDRGCKLLLVEPVMASAGTEMAAAVAQCGLQVMFLNDKLESELPAVEQKNADATRALAEGIATLPDGGDVNGDGKVSCLIVWGEETHIQSRERLTALLEILEQDSNLEILSQSESELTKAGAFRECGRALTQYGRDVEVILTCHSAMTVGAVEAVSSRGWQPGRDMYVLGIGLDRELLPLIRNGAVAGTVWTDPEQQASVTAAAAVELLTDAKTDLHLQIPSVWLTKSDVEKLFP